MEQPLSLFALGPLEVRRDGRPLELGSPLRRQLLALLLHAAPRAVPVPRLVDQLWPEHPPRDPLRNLQVHVSALRAALGGDAVLTEGKAYRLDVAPPQVDVCRFEEEAAAASRLYEAGQHAAALAAAQRALELWRGEAWADVRHLPALEPAAVRLDEQRIDVLALSAAARLALGRHREAVPELEEWVRRWPLREDLREQLMLALHRSGRQERALAAYAAGRRLKVDETGLEPGPGLRDLQARILADDATLAVEDAELRRRRRLPALTTSLFGRSAETTELVELLRGRDCRLATLTGPGGIGKTRLGLRVAHELAPDFADGVWFVGLADVRDPALVARTIAEAVEVEDLEPDAVVALRDHLRTRRLLLVLDNFEQVDDAAPLVSDLLSAAEAVKVLVTSRTRLRVYGEHVRVVEPLAPTAAVPMFTARAREVAPWFDGSATGEIDRVCEALERIPLALELVAARADEVGLAEMLGQLGDRLGLASQGPRDRSDRQRSLRGAIGWSVDLLPARHQEVFRRLGVFLGGFDPAAATHVAGADDEVLADLARASLVRVDMSGRHAMLETIREYAVEQLGEDLAAAASLHADWFLGIAEAGVEGMRGPGREGWFRRLNAERGNMRAALGWLAASSGDRDVERLLRLAGALGLYWYRAAPGSEDVEWLERALEIGKDGAPALVGRVHHALAICRGEQGRAEEALVQSRESYRRLSEADDPAWVARALNTLGGLTRDLGRPAEAVPIMDRAIALRRRLGDPALPLTVALANRAMAALDLDDPATSRECLEECLSVELDHVETALVNRGLADVALAEGRQEEAIARLRAALPVLREADSQRYRLVEVLETLAALAVHRGQASVALALVTAADQVLAQEGAVQVPGDVAFRTRRIGEALAGLDAAERAAAVTLGTSLDLDAALDLGTALLH